MVIDNIKAHFSIIKDYRQSAKIDYPLFDVLFGALCAVTPLLIRMQPSASNSE